MRWPDHRTDLPRTLARVLVLAMLAACSGDKGTGTPPDTGTSLDLQFLHPDPSAPALVQTQAQFYARRGDDRELRMYYHARPGSTDSTEFLRFRVDADALSQRPNGTGFIVGDSILITVTVTDLANLVVDFQPEGLRFASNRPARLKFKFDEADDDLNEDGSVNGDDDSLETELSIWRRESISQPWVRQSSTLNLLEHEIETDVFGFTNYAIAYRR